MDGKWMDLIDKKFDAAVNVVHMLPKEGPVQLDDFKRLRFYGLYKSATIGANETSKPSIFNIEKRLKWKSWKNLEHLGSKIAKHLYVKELIDVMIDIYKSGKTSEIIEKSDMTIIDRISDEDVYYLTKDIEGVDSEALEEFFRLKNIYRP